MSEAIFKDNIIPKCPHDGSLEVTIGLESRWISVKDKLPEDTQEVLVYGLMETKNHWDIIMATFYKEVIVNNERTESQFWEYLWCYDFLDVSHWMPLPKPPEND